MASGRLSKVFNNLSLIESYKYISNQPPPNSFFKGCKQLDIVWTSSTLTPSTIAITPHFFSVGDHRIIVVDFDIDLVMGSGYILFYPQKMRRLISSNDRLVD